MDARLQSEYTPRNDETESPGSLESAPREGQLTRNIWGMTNGFQTAHVPILQAVGALVVYESI